MEHPECECHREAMGWVKDARYTAGGYWECRSRRRGKALKMNFKSGKTLFRIDLYSFSKKQLEVP